MVLFDAIKAIMDANDQKEKLAYHERVKKANVFANAHARKTGNNNIVATQKGPAEIVYNKVTKKNDCIPIYKQPPEYIIDKRTPLLEPVHCEPNNVHVPRLNPIPTAPSQPCNIRELMAQTESKYGLFAPI